MHSGDLFGNSSDMRLSVLDQSPIRTGASPAQAIDETLRLARACDRLGYHRYWLAEHHSSGGLAGSAPEVLIGQVAANTLNMRVGSGGVMLPHYASLKVAENFRMLETLFPGRIDLGLGRAPGSDMRTAAALTHGPGRLPIEHYPRQIADLIGFLRDDLEPDHHFAGIHAMPSGPGVPEIWLLGSSADSATFAAHFGVAFSFAHFINPEGGDRVMRAYQEHFKPGGLIDAPRGSAGVFVICADTEQAALHLRKSRDLWILRLRTGEPGPVPTPEAAEAYPYTAMERMIVEQNRARAIVGAPEQVKAQLEALAADFAVDELVVVTICHDFQARLRSYELLAECFELAAPADAGAAS